jgi:hypothetical protein
MAEVRKWIVNDNDYKPIELLLNQRNSTVACVVSSPDHDKLEKIDRFCSLMVRAKYFGETKMSPMQRELWSKVLYEFWADRMKNRNSLKTYVDNHWSELNKPFPKK